MKDFLLFTLQGRQFALPLPAVRRVERMVALTPLPETSPTVAGMVNLHGETIPVVDLSCRCGLPPRQPRPSDHLLIATAGGRTLALAIEAAERIFTCEPATTGKVPGEGWAAGIADLEGEIVPVLDPGRLLPEGLHPHLEATGAAAC